MELDMEFMEAMLAADCVERDTEIVQTTTGRLGKSRPLTILVKPEPSC